MNILSLAGDAGGARALVPVLKRLAASPGTSLHFQAYAAAEEIWRREGFPWQPPALAVASRCDRVLLGTSWQPEQWELKAIKKAHEAGTRTVSVLDGWVNYRLRFMDRHDRFVLPDAIAVMDEPAKLEMIAEGFPGSCLHVTGHPGLEGLVRYRGAEVAQLARNHFVSQSNIPSPDLVFLFASQPLSQLPDAVTWGFNEQTVLADLTKALNDVLRRFGRRGLLVIKPHPRDTSPYPVEIRHSEGPLDIMVMADHFLDYRELIAASDVVLGINSNLLLEACWLEKIVLSYQPGLRRADPLPANRWGWSRAVYDQATLEQALIEEIFDDTKRARRKRLLGSLLLPHGAVDRIIDLLNV